MYLSSLFANRTNIVGRSRVYENYDNATLIKASPVYNQPRKWPHMAGNNSKKESMYGDK